VLRSKSGGIIGSIGAHEIEFESAKAGMLRRFAVAKELRSRGTGSTMLEQVEAFSKAKGWSHLMFGIDESMERVKQFYFRHGYEEFTENVPQELLDDNDVWYLRKAL
jgi:N-acetylglutamate synthase-like GNAT family acetyltransferase